MMKNLRSFLIFTAIGLASAVNVSAQSSYDDVKYPFATDSLVYENLEQGNWIIGSRQKYTLFPDRRPDNVRLYQGSTSTSYLFDYLWDSNNKLLGLDLKFNLGGQEIVVTELRLTRDAQGNVIEELVKELDQPGSPLKNSERVTYTYNAQNQMLTEVSEDWDDNVSPAAWVKNSKSVYEYANGKLATQLDSFWTTNNVYVFQEKITYEYNANGKLVRNYQKDQFDVETGRTTFTYNSAGYLIEELNETKSGSIYSMNSKDSIILDASNMITQQFAYSFDFTLNKVVLNERMNALGSAVGIFTGNKLLKQLLAYPNPTQGVLNINLNGNTDKSVEVFNVLGDKVMELELNSTQNSIDLSALDNGIYTIRVNSTQGNYQNKIILNK